MPPKAGASDKPRLESLDAPRWIASIQIVFSHFYFSGKVFGTDVVTGNPAGDMGYFSTQGKQWTQMFFMLSGFVLGYVELARNSAKTPNLSSLQYLRKRLVTVWPTYFVAIMCSVLMRMDWSWWDKFTLVPNLLLLQGIVPFCSRPIGGWQCAAYPVELNMTDIEGAAWCKTIGMLEVHGGYGFEYNLASALKDSGDLPGGCSGCFCCSRDYSGLKVSHYPWNGPAWFMSALIAYWLILRPLARFFRNYSTKQCYAWLGALWIASYFNVFLTEQFLGGWEGGDCFDNCLFFSLQNGAVGYVHTFIAGVVAARLFITTSLKDSATGLPVNIVDDCKGVALDPERAPVFLRYGCCIGYSLYIFLVLLFRPGAGNDGIMGNDNLYMFWHNGGLMPPMMLIILGSAVGADPIAKYIFSHPVPQALAQLSFSQYLMQFPVRDYMARFVNVDWEIGYKAWPLSANIAYVFVLIIIAYFVNRYIQRPYSEWQQWRAEKKITGVDDRMIERIDSCTASCWDKLTKRNEPVEEEPRQGLELGSYGSNSAGRTEGAEPLSPTAKAVEQECK